MIRDSHSAEEIQRIIDIWDEEIPFHALQYRNPVMQRLEQLNEPFESLGRMLYSEENSLIEQWRDVQEAAKRTTTVEDTHLERTVDFTRKAAVLRTELGKVDAERVLWLFVEQCRRQEFRHAGWCGTGAITTVSSVESQIDEALERGDISRATRIAARWMYGLGRSAEYDDNDSFGLANYEDDDWDDAEYEDDEE